MKKGNMTIVRVDEFSTRNGSYFVIDFKKYVTRKPITLISVAEADIKWPLHHNYLGENMFCVGLQRWPRPDKSVMCELKLVKLAPTEFKMLDDYYDEKFGYITLNHVMLPVNVTDDKKVTLKDGKITRLKGNTYRVSANYNQGTVAGLEDKFETIFLDNVIAKFNINNDLTRMNSGHYIRIATNVKIKANGKNS